MEYEIIDDLLRLAVENGASDIVMKTDKPGLLRLNGRLKPVEMDLLMMWFSSWSIDSVSHKASTSNMRLSLSIALFIKFLHERRFKTASG